MFSTVLKWMASAPPATQVAPIRPPKSACDELEGRPRYQVVRFHRIAPTSPAKITTGLMSVSSTSPPEIVFATCTDRKAPTRLRHPAIATATLGRSAPVAIEVAIALAVSWKPLVKSKISAVITTTTTITGRPCAVPFDLPPGTQPGDSSLVTVVGGASDPLSRPPGTVCVGRDRSGAPGLGAVHGQ